jgi:DNA recombination protein Rad52
MFREDQIKLLAGKLNERFVKTRQHDRKVLCYVEGWHAIAEANRIFGFDGWDRETVSAQCIWHEIKRDAKACTYTARVRIRVRAGGDLVTREGSGVGHGTGHTLGEAHESALKEAETDATKRALVTFGNCFGLALYDKDQAGVRRATKRLAMKAPSIILPLLNARGEEECRYEMPESYCAGLRDALAAATAAEVEQLWAHNAPTLARLRAGWPELKTVNRTHYADVLEKLYEQHLGRCRSATVAPEEIVRPGAVDKTVLTLPEPKRLRNPVHLRFIGSLPCLVCGRTPSHAHHLQFAQSRAMGSKVSDEWTIPLCVTHHRALHDVGSEEAWWAERGIGAKAEAERLWQQSQARAAANIAPTGSAAE